MINNISNQVNTVRELVLQETYTLTAALFKNKPDLAAKIDSVIEANFSKIIMSKYGISADALVSNLSTAQIDKLNSEIASFQGQISLLNNDITTLTSSIALQQAKISSDNVLLLLGGPNPSLEAEIQALTASVQQEQAQIQSDLAQISDYNTKIQTDQSQLQAAELIHDAAVSSWNSLSTLEKTLFKELFPGVSFPS